MIEYKGFKTQIKYSHEDNVFYGKIENSNDLVSFHGNTLKEAKDSFIESVEDYLKFCKELGKEPDIKE